MVLSTEDEAVACEMEGLMWRRIKEVDPVWARRHRAKYGALKPVPDIFARESLLQRERTIEIELLQARGNIPDFFGLRNQARANLGLPPLTIRR